jgi:hypothetical protein
MLVFKQLFTFLMHAVPLMTLAGAKAKSKTKNTFIVQASIMIITYGCQNNFIVHATGNPFPIYSNI